MDAPPTAGGPGGGELSAAFLVYDAYYEDESAQAELMVPFYHPPTLSLALRCALLSAAASIVNIARNYAAPGDALAVLSLESAAKLAFRSTGAWTMVLTAPAALPDAALSAALQMLHDAFAFYNGSFDAALAGLPANDPGRTHLFARMAALCAPLVPLLRAPALAALPLCELPRHSARLFLHAAQAAAAVRAAHARHRGAVVTFDAGVVCSELDAAATRLVCNLVEHRAADDAAIARAAQRSWLASDTADGAPEADVHVRAVHPDGEAGLALLLLSFSHLALALLLPADLAHDAAHVAALRAAFEPRLYALETAIQRQRREAPTAAHVYRNVAVASASTQPPAPLVPSFSHVRVDLSTGSARAAGAAFADTELSPAPAAAHAFLTSAELAHTLVAAAHGPTEVLLRDHTGATYAHRALDKEVYVHAPLGSTPAVERWMEQFALEVRKAERDAGSC